MKEVVKNPHKIFMPKGGIDVKNDKLIKIISIITLCIIGSLLFLQFQQASGAEAKGTFIIKDYGELKPHNGYPIEEIPTKYEKLLLRSHGLLKKEVMYYSNAPYGVGNSSISIRVFNFANNAHAINGLLMELYRRKKYIKYITINGKPVLQIGSLKWVSGDKYLSISVNNVVDPQPTYNDYISLHPPTVNIQESDFNTQKIFKILVERSHEIIKDADKMRLLPARAISRPEAYIGMVAQCIAESNIRCWTGAYEREWVGCPVTLMKEDISRKKEWKKFKEQSASRPIVEENINWTVPHEGKCQFRSGEIKPGDDTRTKYDVRWLMLDELNMSAAELKHLPEKPPDEFLPTMFE